MTLQTMWGGQSWLRAGLLAGLSVGDPISPLGSGLAGMTAHPTSLSNAER
jgi:hypothetical protein